MPIRKENMNTSFFHIMVQGNNKEYIFDKEEDRNEYRNVMINTKQKIDSMILAYCIMSNHAHILFYEKNIENLTKYMHRVNLLYAQYYNQKYDRVGHVFRSRYKIQPIYNEKHLHTCVRYIHNNPVKANICKKPEEYPYSSIYKNVFYTDTELERNIKRDMYVQGNNINEEEFNLMEDDLNKEQIANKVLNEILMLNNITKEQLYYNEKVVGLIIKKLKIENNISYRKMEEILGINRKKLRIIEKQQELGKKED